MTNSDKSYKLLNSVIESLENKYGYISNVQTLKEGRVNFKYEVMFCNDNNETTVKFFEVYLGSEYVKMLKK
tara:strand:- start:318 stop:530 length:213 start_codon:yes stop_codon:yes gene_type:complete